MLGEKEFKRWNWHDEQLALRLHTGGDTGVGFGGTYLTQTSHSSLAQGLFSAGLMIECHDCCFHSYQHDWSVSGLITSTGILESDESPEPFMLVLAYMTFLSNGAQLVHFFDPLIMGRFISDYFKKGWLSFYTWPCSVLCRFLPGLAQLDSLKRRILSWYPGFALSK